MPAISNCICFTSLSSTDTACSEIWVVVTLCWASQSGTFFQQRAFPFTLQCGMEAGLRRFPIFHSFYSCSGDLFVSGFGSSDCNYLEVPQAYTLLRLNLINGCDVTTPPEGTLPISLSSELSSPRDTEVLMLVRLVNKSTMAFKCLRKRKCID